MAFDQYSRAKTLILASSLDVRRDKNLLQAIELLNSAVARDPSFHAAFCQLVDVHDQLYVVYGDHTPARLAAAEAALQRATELRPNAPETHLARGSHLYHAFRDYKGALSELEAARAGLPNDPRILAVNRLPSCSARASAKKDYALWNRRWRSIHAILTCFHNWRLAIMCLRRYPEQKATLQRILEITPDDVGVASSFALLI